MRYLDPLTLQSIIYLHYCNKKDMCLWYFSHKGFYSLARDLSYPKELALSFFFKKDSRSLISGNNLKEFYKKKKDEYEQSEAKYKIDKDMLNELNSIINKKGIEFTVHGVLSFFDLYPKVNELFLLKIYSDKKERVGSFIDEYLRHFLDDNLDPKGINEYFGFNKSIEEVSNLIEKNIEKYDKKEFWIAPTIETEKGLELIDKEIRFYDSLIFFKMHKCIDFLDSEFKSIEISNSDRKYILNVKIRPLIKTSKFLNQYEHLINDKNTALKLEYNEEIRRIYLIDLVKNNKIVLKEKMYRRSEPKVIFEYLYNNSNPRVDYDTLRKEVFRELKKELKNNYLPKIPGKLGFKGTLKDLFFPEISQDYLKFRKEITKEELKSKKINLSKEIKNFI